MIAAAGRDGLARLGLILALVWSLLGAAAAQELSALARLDPAASRVTLEGDQLAVDLAISQPVPWRVRVLDGPPRLVVDMREVDWTGLRDLPRPDAVRDMRAGIVRPGWSRLVLELDGPWAVRLAEMTTGAATRVRLRLDRTDAAAFAATAARPEPAQWALPEPADLPPVVPRRMGEGPLIVVLDPGHGGIDPGAERGGVTEADLMLTVARELKELMLRAGGFTVVLTREEDTFVPLETRISIARAAGADVFVALHADALAEGEAVGATVYTLADEASDAAARTLAERHDRDDLLAGVDLTGQDDVIAHVLMDIARTETAPRTERLAVALVAAIQAEGLRMHRHPRQAASFSVLKSPDIPSALIELGFLSSERDLKRLTDPDWRARMGRAIVAALRSWADAEAANQAITAP